MIWKNGWIAWNRRSAHWQKNSVSIFIQKSDKTQTVVLVLQTETYCEIYMKCILYCGCKWKWRVIVAVNFQFKQLKGRSLKSIRASTGFEPVTSARPVRCSTNWAVKPHSSYLSLKWNYVKYMRTAVVDESEEWSQPSWSSIAPVSRKSRVWIQLKPWYFSGFFFPVT